MKNKNVFGKEYRFSKNMINEKKQELIKSVEDGMAYID